MLGANRVDKKGNMMKKTSGIMLFLALFLVQGQALGNIYLWQTDTEMGGSCCLHISGTDICNPQMRCTHYMRQDLSGILDYVVRLLATEKSRLEPYYTLLTHIKKYIREILSNPYNTLEYHSLEHRPVRFYHDIIDAALKQKDNKQIAKPKPKQDEFVAQYLMKLGLLKKRK